jgi:2-oxoisovalerate dehydrogenase E1 component beta subunit
VTIAPEKPSRTSTGGTVTLNFIQAITRALDEELGRDEQVVVFGQDVGARGGVFLATEGLQAKYGKTRVLDTPLSEAGIVGMAIGMALRGLRPVAEIQFSDYIYPGFDQIVSQAAKIRYRSGGQFNVPMVIRTPSGGGVKGGHHHSQSPEAHFTHTPGLKVVMPSTPADARGLLKSAIRDDDPVIFFEPKRIYRAVKGEVDLSSDEVIPLGQAVVRLEGQDLTLISYGGMMVETLRAAEVLESDGVSVEVIDLRSLVPWDMETVLASVAKTGRVVVINEAPLTTGFASEITATIAEELLDQLEAPPARVAGFDTPYPYALDKTYLPGVNRILRAAAKVLDY